MTIDELNEQIAHHETAKATFQHWLENSLGIPNNYQAQIDSEDRILAGLYEARLRLQDTMRETPEVTEDET